MVKETERYYQMTKKVLFIADGYALGENAGAILYRRIMEVYGTENFCYFGIGNKTRKKWPKVFQHMPKESHTLRIWPRIKGLKYLKKIPFIEELYYFSKIPYVRYRLKEFAKRHDVDVAFVLLRADVLAVIKETLFNDIKNLGFISDTVEAEQFDKKKIYSLKRNNYFKAIRDFDGIYVAGETMDNYIKNNFSKDTSILRLGYESNIPKRSKNSINNFEIRIFFAGSVYAKNEMENFVKALAMFQKRHPEFKLIFITATNYKIKRQCKNIKIKELGWSSEQELISYMQNSHFGYVPYKFDDKSKHQMSYAFPSKIGFYISTGLPVFFHGPDYSSVGSFFNKYKCGVHCASIETSKIVEYLEEVFLDEDHYSHLLKEAHIAFKNEFSLIVLEQNFKKLIER